ncbi:RNA 2',3'-cyclic phosphodiesterase [Clostridium paridis]|uniref:RNA 2',3'-cyclic phosphodiesterase n=1 Tax=Clostridium paridis TaxID=2803863 RepID=A0A937FGX4_9CLOT|nr:RNA 2',3'-cyclic phosphodiesterase [Clostridium paridis]MBL4932785.1 RNA 2',3'-cyclic phosphodiesterase [Clostridium paridis]
MRVYIAIDFDNNIKNYLDKITSNIKNYCIEGSFTQKNNFHLTIRFIGEAADTQITRIKEIMDKSLQGISSFELLIGNLGIFKRKKTNILWMGIEENTVLSELHKELTILLQEYKIPFYDKLYMPHITLGRRVLLNEDYKGPNDLIKFERVRIPVKTISLMASKEENGKLNGVPIYRVNLKELL